MQQYIGDAKVTICLAGLRWIMKEDRCSAASVDRFYLTWNYKGGADTAEYKNREDRDQMYNRVKTALESLGNKDGKSEALKVPEVGQESC